MRTDSKRTDRCGADGPVERDGDSKRVDLRTAMAARIEEADFNRGAPKRRCRAAASAARSRTDGRRGQRLEADEQV